ncbi:hypothetical protein ABZ468_41615 [Streptomyces sp. NPDC005708]|uniref:hypothetical protein n=1 Tax=Streptomyces sp. NPDC005708 TaxID=3154564 RepID=UPI0033F212D5
MLEVERGWRDMETIIDLRPVYHRKEDRIRAHVLLCWLALLLIRIAETTCEDTDTAALQQAVLLCPGVFAPLRKVYPAPVLPQLTNDSDEEFPA